MLKMLLMRVLLGIIHKLRLSELFYKIESLLSVDTGSFSFETHDEAMSFLHSISPDNGHSCIIKRTANTYDYDLEIIVPCYNSEKYIEECVDSILIQVTNYSFRVLIINDGSNDKTRQILKKYDNLKNVTIIDQDNKGHSGARNVGISQAQGRYLMFVDSDDVLLPGSIEGLMSLAESHNVDIVDSGYIRFADSYNKNILSKAIVNIYNSIQSPQLPTSNQYSSRLTGYAWGKVLKAELFSNIQFPMGYWFEDTIVWMILEPLSKSIVLYNKPSTRYRMNLDSVSHIAVNSLKSIDSLYVTLSLLKDRKLIGIEFDQYQYDLLLRQMRINFNRVAKLDTKIKQAVYLIESDLIINTFSSWTTEDPTLKPIESLLRKKDYTGFKLWCKWHS